MKVAIFGSNSLLASYLIDTLATAPNNELTLFGRTADPARDNSTFISFNYPYQVPDFGLLLSFDLIIYCAATGVQANKTVDTSLVYGINAYYPIDIINYLTDQQYTGKWISFGSYFELGDSRDDTLFSEEAVITSFRPVPNHYCSSKRLLTRFFSNGLYSIAAYHFILPTIYGARENAARLIPYIVSSLQKGSEIKLSAGTQIRQYIHCQDVATLIELVAYGAYAPGIYNVSHEAPIPVHQVVKAVFDQFGKSATPYLGTLQTRDESMQYLALNAKKITEAVPEWQPAIKLQDAIKEYL